MTRVFCSILCAVILTGVTVAARAAAPAPATPDPRQQTFDKLVDKVEKDPAAATNDEVAQLLQLGKDLGRPYPASQAAKSFFAQHQTPPPAVVLLAADNARMAGDFRSAASRYKQYLQNAAPGPEASAAAANLYSVLIDFLSAGDDAFRVMNEIGDKFRQTPEVKKYDSWFIGTAAAQKAYPAAARRLVQVFSDQLPLEQERLCYWDSLDWLMNEITWPRPEMYEALPDCRKLVTMIRESPKHTARSAFFVANLAFKAGSAGKEPAVLEKEYGTVAAAARAYVDSAPTAGTVQEILQVFAGGLGRFDYGELVQHIAQKRDVFVYAFNKLSDPDRETMIGWNWGNINTIMATPEQWEALAVQHPDAFKHPETAMLSFITMTPDLNLFKAQAAFLQTVQSPSASVINSMAAATSDDIWPAVQHLMQQESWYMPPGQSWELLQNPMWPAFSTFPRDAAHKLPAGYYETLLLRFGSEYIVQTPMAFLRPDVANGYINAGWVWGTGADANDKTTFVQRLRSLDWVPYTAEQRTAVFGPVYTQFKAWAESVRQSNAVLQKNVQDLTKGLGDAKAARAATAKLQDANKTAAADTAKAQADATKSIADTQKAQADAAKAQTAAQAALTAAQATKDAAKITAATAPAQAAAKTVADLAAKLVVLQKSGQDLATKAQQLTAAATQLTAQATQQDAQILDLTKKSDDAAKQLQAAAPQLALITPIEEGFKKSLDPKVADPTKAPNPTCLNFAKTVAAIQQKNLAQYLEAAHALYALVRDSETKKTPLGNAILVWLVSNRLDAFDTFDFQCEVLTDQLAMYVPGGINRNLHDIFSTMLARPNWTWNAWPAADKPRIIKINNILAKTIDEQTAKSVYSPELFNWFRYTRRGNGWAEAGLNSDVLGRMIEKKTFFLNPVRLAHPTASCDYMYMIRNEFQDLQAKYPVDKYFDDMFVEETRKSGYVDHTFWYYSPDYQHKAYNIAAQMFQDFAKLPFGYGDEKVVYGRAEFWEINNVRLPNADEPIRNAAFAKMESYYGKTRFDEAAMGKLALPYINASIPSGRKEFFDKLNIYMDRAAASPVRIGPPFCSPVTQLGPPANLSPAELNSLVRMFSACLPWAWQGSWYMETLAATTHEGLLAQKRYSDMFMLAPHFWRIARDTNNGAFWRQMAQYSGALMDAGQLDLAAAYGSDGLEIVNTAVLDDVRNTLLAVRSKALSTIGSAIPVGRADPRYPIYMAQAAYLGSNYDNAWDLYVPSRALVMQMYKDLDPSFTTWLIEKNTDVANYDDAEALSKVMLQWVDSAPQGFETEVRAHLLVAYAGIAFARQEYPRARAQYEQISLAKEFDDTPSKRTAELKVAEVDRLTKHYDKAVEQLEKLTHRPDRVLQVEANYLLALIKYDQEQYPEARAYLDQVFAIQPNHTNARILEGKLYLKMKKLVEATEVKVGLASSQETIVPGKPLKVQLEDRNLAVVGQAANIEIHIWTDSGDDEYFHLLPFGDSKTKFEGQIATALAPPKKDDHILDVRGGDVVHYDYSDKFKQANKIGQAEPLSINVVSDSELYVSSGKILTKDEQDARALERMIRSRILLDTAAASGIALSTVRAEDEIKPGNKINVRVIDPDQSINPGKNQIKVRAATSSGDRIDAFMLNETGPYTGVFEGQVPTASAPATAFASDSEEGREPNFAITKGDYPPWVALADNRRPKIFSMDLNNNVPLGPMKIVADVPGRHLKRMVLQTSMNGKEFSDAGAWPVALPAWDGTPRLELVRYAGMNGVPANLAELREYLDVGHAAGGAEKIVISPAPLSVNFDPSVGGNADKLTLAADGVNSWYIGHLQAAFYLSTRQVRTFRIDYKGRSANLRYHLTIDGREGRDPFEFSQSLGKGAHRLDVYFCAQRQAQPVFDVVCDVPQPPYIAPCPPEMFDIKKHPEITAAVGFQPAEILADTELKTRQDNLFNSLAAAKAAQAVVLKAQADAQAALKAAQTAKDAAKVAAITKQLDELNPKVQEVAAAVTDFTHKSELVAKTLQGAAPVAADGSVNAFYVSFAPQTHARVLRLWIVDFETDAPAIRKITLADADGKTVLPPAQDVVKLKENDTLEIVPGDRITITYEDPKFVTKEKQVVESSLTATFHDATLSACFIESVLDEHGNRRPNYIPMRRFKVGDTINVFINDPDRDTTDGRDVVKFTAQAPGTPGGKPVELEAVETEEHSGVFIGKVFPVAGVPQRPSEITIGKSDDLTLSYLDEENTDPGIPWVRSFVVEQTTGVVPDMRVYDSVSRELTEGELRNVPANSDSRHFEEFVPITRQIIATRPGDRRPADKPVTALIGCPLVVELTYPTIAQSPLSKATLYVQTAAGRKKYGKPLQGDFDVNVPGTIKIERGPGDLGAIQPPPGYSDVLVRSNPYAADPLEDGRFTFLVPMRLGAVPDHSLVAENSDDNSTDTSGDSGDTGGRRGDEEDTKMLFAVPYVDEKGETRWSYQWVTLPTLSVRGDDEIFVGFQYQDETGATKWLTQRVKLTSDVLFDVMDERFQQPISAIHLGGTLYLRIIHPARDTSDEKDEIPVSLAAASGARVDTKLVETFGHSGIFKGACPLVLAGDPTKPTDPGSLAVKYGDTVQLTYKPADGVGSLARTVMVYKGATGTVLPFTKGFKDPEMAVQTQFTIAEAYFEMAKKHRDLQQEELARREIGQGKKLLEEAIRDYPNTDVQAQANYLLADLSLEFANDATDKDVKKKHYMEAILRFSDIVASYPDSSYAPKSQFKKALTFEKMGEMDQACEEYVKLSYRYPDNELVAETIARLGEYFLRKGKEFQDKAAAETNVVENEKIKLQAREMYTTAAQVFGRLATRFPDHHLAGKTTVLSAQCYMRAENYPKAIAVFKQVVDEKKAEPDLIAQAMYWGGDCSLKQGDAVNAYRLFKKLTWDYPESTWAKYARGRLTEDALSHVETTETDSANQ